MPDAPALSITLIRTMMNHATIQVFIPIARAYASVEAAVLMVADAAQNFDQGRSTGKEANMAKLLASEPPGKLRSC